MIKKKQGGMVMVCPFCGAVLPDDARKCNLCGAVRTGENPPAKSKAWGPYLILGVMFAAGLAVYLVTALLG